MKIEDLIAEAISLPVEDREMVIEALVESLNPPEPEIEKEWVAVAERRLQELCTGEVQEVPAEDVLRGIWNELLGSFRTGGHRSG